MISFKNVGWIIFVISIKFESLQWKNTSENKSPNIFIDHFYCVGIVSCSEDTYSVKKSNYKRAINSSKCLKKYASFKCFLTIWSQCSRLPLHLSQTYNLSSVPLLITWTSVHDKHVTALPSPWPSNLWIHDPGINDNRLYWHWPHTNASILEFKDLSQI